MTHFTDMITKVVEGDDPSSSIGLQPGDKVTTLKAVSILGARGTRRCTKVGAVGAVVDIPLPSPWFALVEFPEETVENLPTEDAGPWRSEVWKSTEGLEWERVTRRNEVKDLDESSNELSMNELRVGDVLTPIEGCKFVADSLDCFIILRGTTHLCAGDRLLDPQQVTVKDVSTRAGVEGDGAQGVLDEFDLSKMKRSVDRRDVAELDEANAPIKAGDTVVTNSSDVHAGSELVPAGTKGRVKSFHGDQLEVKWPGVRAVSYLTVAERGKHWDLVTTRAQVQDLDESLGDPCVGDRVQALIGVTGHITNSGHTRKIKTEEEGTVTETDPVDCWLRIIWDGEGKPFSDFHFSKEGEYFTRLSRRTDVQDLDESEKNVQAKGVRVVLLQSTGAWDEYEESVRIPEGVRGTSCENTPTYRQSFKVEWDQPRSAYSYLGVWGKGTQWDVTSERKDVQGLDEATVAKGDPVVVLKPNTRREYEQREPRLPTTDLTSGELGIVTDVYPDSRSFRVDWKAGGHSYLGLQRQGIEWEVRARRTHVAGLDESGALRPGAAIESVERIRVTDKYGDRLWIPKGCAGKIIQVDRDDYWVRWMHDGEAYESYIYASLEGKYWRRVVQRDQVSNLDEGFDTEPPVDTLIEVLEPHAVKCFEIDGDDEFVDKYEYVPVNTVGRVARSGDRSFTVIWPDATNTMLSTSSHDKSWRVVDKAVRSQVQDLDESNQLGDEIVALSPTVAVNQDWLSQHVGRGTRGVIRLAGEQSFLVKWNLEARGSWVSTVYLSSLGRTWAPFHLERTDVAELDESTLLV